MNEAQTRFNKIDPKLSITRGQSPCEALRDYQKYLQIDFFLLLVIV